MKTNTLKIKNWGGHVKTYVFTVAIEEEDDSRWSAVIPTLPGCNAWGNTQQEALEAIRENAQAFVEVLLEHGDPLPEEARNTPEIQAPAVAVNI